MALSAKVRVQVVQNGKRHVAKFAAERNNSEFNPLKGFSVIVAVAVVVPLMLSLQFVVSLAAA